MRSQLAMVLSLLLSACLMAACGSGGGTTAEDCFNGEDDDGDGLIDCDDVDDCSWATTCSSDEICDNGEDDDGDGETDCDDSDCDDHADCEVEDEICDNGEDDDGDGETDCDDSDCGGAPECPGTEDCDNGDDDDDDGDIDCDDSDCEDYEDCLPDEICDNGDDDDRDGDTDCDDSDCFGTPECPDTENCDNGEDDDGDGDTDCDDSDCEDDEACLPDEICDNGEDDDGDGDVDCDDGDCSGTPECPGTEICDNGEDDDGDDDVDCDDSDCEGNDACPTPDEVCGNGIDDDGDDDVDCDDSDCVDDPLCTEDCDNGEDDDGDGDVDCADADCVGDDACAENCINGVDDDGDGLVDCMDPACDFDDGCIELCNGIDDDGDGLVDEHPRDPRIGEDCYDGPDSAAGVGQCEMGTNECFGGAIVCQGWIAPLADELCDGLDNDCDGVIPAEEADEDCGTVVTPDDPVNLELETEIRDVDVHINLDTTGSMGGELATLQDSLSSTIIPDVRSVLPTAAFGLSTFDDFPLSSWGGGEDWPFTLHQRITSDVSAVQGAIDGIGTHWGSDGPESGIESLYQIATGAGVSWTADWDAEDCDGGGDEDGDGLTNCEDPDCYEEVGCWWWPYEDCDNGEDDDMDGYVDCDDPNCAASVYGMDTGCWSDTPMVCGNGRIDRWEECDDGNTDDGDGCDDNCDVEPGCGNARVGGAEQCDDNNNVDGDGCSASCEVEPDVCGNDVIGAYEQCDDGNTDDGDGCDSGCLLEPSCGDSAFDPDTEECDDGNSDDGDGCDSDCTLSEVGVPAMDCDDGFDAGLGHGTLGGVCFRDTSIPLVVHITDNSSHEGDDYDSLVSDPHGSVETIAALNAMGAHIIGVRTGGGAMSADETDPLYPLGMAVWTNTIVPLCAFDDSAARTSGACADDECCTGVDGAGVAPLLGECPLVFDTTESGGGLETSIIDAIEAVTRFITYELTVVARDDPSDAVNAECFIDSIGIAGSASPDGCSVDPVGVDTDGDGVIDTLTNATPRTRATFHVEVVNEDVNDVDGDGDTAEACASTGLYGVYLDVIADGRTVVASRRLEVEIP